jgi:hypothetical protein
MDLERKQGQHATSVADRPAASLNGIPGSISLAVTVSKGNQMDLDRLKQFELTPPEFDPRRDVRFRGKSLCDLDKSELLEALCQALTELKRWQR